MVAFIFEFSLISVFSRGMLSNYRLNIEPSSSDLYFLWSLPFNKWFILSTIVLFYKDITKDKTNVSEYNYIFKIFKKSEFILIMLSIIPWILYLISLVYAFFNGFNILSGEDLYGLGGVGMALIGFGIILFPFLVLSILITILISIRIVKRK